MMKNHTPPIRLMTAWKKLMLTFLAAYGVSLLTGWVLLNVIHIQPEAVFEASTKRLAYALPILAAGSEAGIDGGVLLFIWNTVGALATLSFIYTAALFNPLNRHKSPQFIRKIFCSRSRMKLLCFLPGCRKIDAEPLRRLYVWLMVPYLGMMLLGIEVGFSASTANHLFGSYLTGIVALLPHGIIEIPAIALAGAVVFSAHLLIKPHVAQNQIDDVFKTMENHRNKIPMQKVIWAVIICLLLAGLIEAHVTQPLVIKMST